MNPFLIQIDNILKNNSLPRHNTPTAKEHPEDLPPELWTADRVWVRRCGHVPPLTALYEGPYTVLQRSLRHFRLRIGGREDNVSTSRLKPCTTASEPTATPPRRGRPPKPTGPQQPPPKRVRFTLPTPTATADSGTVFPDNTARFFARPEHATARRNPHRSSRPPPWHTDFTFLAHSATKKLGGAL